MIFKTWSLKMRKNVFSNNSLFSNIQGLNESTHHSEEIEKI